ncbi:hypothetical protein ACIRL2_18685 [Embleya sp. NPDC127516]|uniref:hypothetical protein n=1 Tax=Embleya sp. NPDC127516 TaxID=3363990 RepID=UPI0037F5BFA0
MSNRHEHPGLPALNHLGLMDSEISDEIATALASAPIVARLKELDLSMGTLSNAGAEVLMAGQPLTHLDRLDARHHFLDEATQSRLRSALAGVDVDLSDTRNDWGGKRYVEVSE